MSLEIRDAEPNEAACISALALRSKAHWGYSPEFMKSCEDELTYQPNQLSDARFHFVVGQQGSEIVGFYSLEAMSKRQFELGALFIEPEQIGKGIHGVKNWIIENLILAKESVL